MMKRYLKYQDLGKNINYIEAWQLQENLQKELISFQNSENKSSSYDHLLLLEHQPVFTLGKSGKISHLLTKSTELEKIGVDFVETSRGGDITFHGLGQLVGYPIMDLNCHKKDVKWYMRQLEEVLINTLSYYKIKGERSNGETGVWLDVGKPYARKIAQLGVKLSRWVTLHGFALNANVDLAYFNHIIPCGIKGKSVTSIEKEIGKPIDIQELKKKLLKEFLSVFDLEITD